MQIRDEFLVKLSDTYSTDSVIYRLIGNQAPLVVKSLEHAAKNHNHIGEFLNGNGHSKGRLFFEKNNEFSDIFSTCGLIHFSKKPDDFVAGALCLSKAAFAKFEEKIYYIDNFSKIKSINCSPAALKAINSLLSGIDKDTFIPLSEKDLQRIKQLCNYDPENITDEFGRCFSTLEQASTPGDFYDGVKELMHFLFSPVAKSPQWQEFWSKQKKKMGGLKHLLNNKGYVEATHASIVAAFTFKIMSFWINRCQFSGRWSEKSKQIADAVTKVGMHIKKETFVTDCHDKLRFEMSTRLSDNTLLGKNETQSYENLIGVEEDLYFKLSLPNSWSIFIQEIQRGEQIRKKALEYARSMQAKEQDNKEPGFFRAMHSGSLSPKKSSPRTDSDKSHSSPSPSPERVPALHVTSSNSTPPINIPSKPREMLLEENYCYHISPLPLRRVPKERIPATSPFCSPRENTPVVNYPARSVRNLPRLTEEKSQEEAYTLLYGNKKIPVTPGEMLIEGKSYLFFAVPAHEIKSTPGLESAASLDSVMGKRRKGNAYYG